MPRQLAATIINYPPLFLSPASLFSPLVMMTMITYLPPPCSLTPLHPSLILDSASCCDQNGEEIQCVYAQIYIYIYKSNQRVYLLKKPANSLRHIRKKKK